MRIASMQNALDLGNMRAHCDICFLLDQRLGIDSWHYRKCAAAKKMRERQGSFRSTSGW